MSYYSIRKGSLLKKGKPLSPLKGTPFIPQKGHVVCSSKRAGHFSLKNYTLFVPQKAMFHIICPSKRVTWFVLHKGMSFVPQSHHIIHPPKRACCLAIKTGHKLFLKKDMSFVLQKRYIICRS